MTERWVTLISSLAELKLKLRSLALHQHDDSSFRGRVAAQQGGMAALRAEPELRESVGTWLRQGRYATALKLWVGGFAIDWTHLYAGPTPRRISLPSYVFDLERYWIPPISAATARPVATPRLHPLVHRNTSTFQTHQYTSDFAPSEFFFRDHELRGRGIAPGTLYLELARAAGSLATAQDVTQLRDIRWTKPLLSREPQATVRVALFPNASLIGFEITTNDDAGELLHCRGSLLTTTEVRLPSPIDIAAVKARCSGRTTASVCYDYFRQKGLAYGPSFQVIDTLWHGATEVLAKLKLPSAQGTSDSTAAELVLNPTLLDAALQAIVGFALAQAPETRTGVQLPYSLEALTLYRPLPEELYAYVTPGSNFSSDGLSTYDIVLTDLEGQPLAVLERLAVVGGERVEVTFENEATGELLFATPRWVAEPLVRQANTLPPQRDVLLLAHGFAEHGAPSLADAFPQAEVLELTEGRLDTAVARAFDACLQWIQERARVPQRPASLILIALPDDPEHYPWSALAGLLKTAAREDPRVSGRLLFYTPALPSAELVELIRTELAAPSETVEVVSYDAGGTRRVSRHQELGLTATTTSDRLVLEPNGVYWITGGLGGLGRILATGLAAPGISLVLSGRSPLTAEGRAQLAALAESGATFDYVQADVGDRNDVEQAFRHILEKHGRLTGIFHCAGVSLDAPIASKTPEQAAAVLRPKLSGLVNLDETTRDYPLSWFVAFSSLAAVVGNPGQADYASANAFMDGYCRYRDQLCKLGSRHGKTVSINWPLWQDGGMSLDGQRLKLMFDTSGLMPLPTRLGLHALEIALTSSESQVIVAHGNKKAVARTLFGQTALRSEATSVRTSLPGRQNDDATTTAVENLSALLASFLKVRRSKIQPDAALESLGLDSIMVVNLTNKLEAHLGPLPKTLFVDYKTVGELGAYFAEHHARGLARVAAEEGASRTREDTNGNTAPSNHRASSNGPAPSTHTAPSNHGSNGASHANGKASNGQATNGKAAAPTARTSEIRAAASDGAELPRPLPPIQRIPAAPPLPSGATPENGSAQNAASRPGSRLEELNKKLSDRSVTLGDFERITTRDDIEVAVFDKLAPEGKRRVLRHGPPAPEVLVGDAAAPQKNLLNFSTYNYLGLSAHPAVLESAKEALERYGLGAGASPAAGGKLAVHHALESELLSFFGKGGETGGVTLFAAGYNAVFGPVSAYMGAGDHIVMDAYAHASLVDGALHSGARVHYYRHNDMDSLADLLRDLDDGSNRILIGTEGVFSADGDYGNIADVVTLAKKHGAKVLVDEAHSLLLAGEGGRGVCAEQGVLDEVDILVGTFSKSFGGVGGFALTSKALANYFSLFSRNRLFSCALDPAVTGGLLASLRLAAGDVGDEKRRRLAANSQYLRTLLKARVPLTGTSTWIVPVVFERESIVPELSEYLLQEGMVGSMMMFPSVPKGKARLRLFVSSEHTADQLERAAKMIIKAGEKFGFATIDTEVASVA